LRLSGTNGWLGTTTIAGGTLQLGSATTIPNGSLLVLNNATLNDGGFSEIIGSISLVENSTIILGNSNHSLTFTSIGAFTAGKMLTINGWTQTTSNSAVTTNGAITTTSSNFVTSTGAKRSNVLGSKNQFGQILYGFSGGADILNSIFMKSTANATILSQIQIFNPVEGRNYNVAQKVSPSFEIVASTIK